MAGFGPAVPILRSFDEGAARAFYLDWLGATVLFEHRFAPDMPLYMGLSLYGIELHLSEHHGDCAPGARIRIRVPDIDAWSAGSAPGPTRTSAPARPNASPGASAT